MRIALMLVWLGIAGWASGLKFVSREPGWTQLRLYGQSEVCDISVRDEMNRESRVVYDGGNCVGMYNSKGAFIVCTLHKQICKTEREIVRFADRHR